MKSGCKKLFSVCIAVFLLVSLVCPSYQLGFVPETTERFLSCKGPLYLERFCPVNELGISGGGIARHTLQTMRKQISKLIPLGLRNELEDKEQVVKIVYYHFVGVVFLAVFMSIIIYIFRTDGKKRVLL